MLAKTIGTWLAVAAFLLGACPAHGATSAEVAARLAHAKAALTATRGQLTPEQWALLSDKLAGAEKDKNGTSDARGGPWTPRFREIFERAGMTLSDPANLVKVKGHRGPHPEQYHRQIRDALKLATDDCVGVAQCRERLTRALGRLGVECSTPGTRLNQWITTPAVR